MPVLAEMYSVVIRVATLDALYPGGVEAYEADRPNATFCSDHEVCRIGFMAWSDVETFLRHLERFNITMEAGFVAIIREDKGLLQPTEWLEFARVDGTPMARLSGSTVGYFVAPPGWKPGHQNVLTTETALRQRELVSSKDGVDSYRDPSTGDVLHVGRAQVPDRNRPWWRFWGRNDG
jgi:hypothetical protein